VTYGRRFSIYAETLLGGISLLAAVCAFSQTPPVESKVVPFVSDSCPSVRIGDKVSLDLNPNFDPIWPVTDLRGFSLTFAPVAEDGINLKKGELVLRAPHTHASNYSLGNGYFHLEFALSTKSIQPGTYRLIRANATAEVVPDYDGESPRMTKSPVEERYCFTFLGPPPSHSPQPEN
jgi:hypothetical protein